MRHDTVPEKGGLAAEGAVEELIGHHKVPGNDLLAEAADRTGRHQPHDAELLHRVDVGAEVQLARLDPVAAAVARQEGDAALAEAPDDDLVGRVSEGRRQPDPLDLAEFGELVEAAAADDAEGRGSCIHGRFLRTPGPAAAMLPDRTARPGDA